MSKKLNLAVFCTASLPIPPFAGYGGTQRGVYDFLVQMNKKRHKLHLLGSGDSKVSGLENVILHSTINNSLWIPENTLPIDVKEEQSKRHFENSIEEMEKLNNSEELDIINVRFDNLPVLEKIVDIFGQEKIVYSLHNIRNMARIESIKDLGIQCIAHCRNHLRQYGNLSNIKIITYGIDVQSYPFSQKTLSQSDEIPRLDVLKRLKEQGKDYLITLGAIGKHKGQRTSIEIAKKTNNPLIIAGTPQDRTNREKSKYFEQEVLPYVNGEDIIYFGNADEKQKKELLKFATAFLFPSGFEDTTWNEPFGRAPIEALATGTPIIAYRKGSMPEIVFDGFNGFLFNTMNGAIEKTRLIKEISRRDCRRTAEVKFNSPRVAKEYESLFYSMLKI